MDIPKLVTSQLLPEDKGDKEARFDARCSPGDAGDLLCTHGAFPWRSPMGCSPLAVGERGHSNHLDIDDVKSKR